MKLQKIQQSMLKEIRGLSVEFNLETNSKKNSKGILVNYGILSNSHYYSETCKTKKEVTDFLLLIVILFIFMHFTYLVKVKSLNSC